MSEIATPVVLLDCWWLSDPIHASQVECIPKKPQSKGNVNSFKGERSHGRRSTAVSAVTQSSCTVRPIRFSITHTWVQDFWIATCVGGCLTLQMQGMFAASIIPQF
ncbi:MAG: hypothetical protein KME22_00225 [Hassallia sp. WJT32-NPBG1]|nr:hypothetical protein [Hassallia sp. WJT32-NPBG1]